MHYSALTHKLKLNAFSVHPTQVANRLRAQANSVSYPRRPGGMGKW